MEHDCSRLADIRREHRDLQAKAITMHNTVASGAWPQLAAHTHAGWRQRPLPAGGVTQGAQALRPHSSSAGFDVSKHGWHHPAAQARRLELADPARPGCWAEAMRKAKDHTGYGERGLVDTRQIQITAVSGDAPGWFNGTRTLPGPRGTKKHPVRRCPLVQLEGKAFTVRARTFELGEGLSTSEHYHDRHTPPTPVPVVRAGRYDDTENKATRNNLERGCQPLPEVFPASRHMAHDSFQPPRMRTLTAFPGP